MPADAERLTQQLVQLEQRLKARGLPDLNQDQIKTLVNVMTTHQLTEPMDYDLIADQVVDALRSSQEGGLINDRSGKATEFLRQRQGILPMTVPR